MKRTGSKFLFGPKDQSNTVTEIEHGKIPFEKTLSPNMYAYLLYQYNVKTYIALISTISGVPEETITNSIIRTYFRNGKIVPEDFKSFADDTFEGDAANNASFALAFTGMLEKEDFMLTALDFVKGLPNISKENKELFEKRWSQINYEYEERDKKLKSRLQKGGVATL